MIAADKATARPAGELGLPEPFRIADFDGSTAEWLRRCRWQFEAIVDGHIQLWGRPVVAGADAETTFWHIVTGDVGWSTTRRLDLRRCEVLGRAWDLLERLADDDPRACSWREERGKASRRTIMVAPVDFSLLVVLRECRTSLLLVTAYPQGRRKAAKRLARDATGTPCRTAA